MKHWIKSKYNGIYRSKCLCTVVVSSFFVTHDLYRLGCRLWKHTGHHFIFLPSGCEKHWPHSAYNSESIQCIQPPPTLTCHCFVLCVQRETAAVCTYIIGPIYQCSWKIELVTGCYLVKCTGYWHIFFTVPASKKLVLEKTASANPLQTSVCMSLCIHYVRRS